MTQEKKTKAPKKKTESKATAPKRDVETSEANAPAPSKVAKAPATRHPSGSCFASASKDPLAGTAFARAE